MLSIFNFSHFGRVGIGVYHVLDETGRRATVILKKKSLSEVFWNMLHNLKLC